MAVDHRDIDARSLALHRLVAEKLRRHPDLFARVPVTLARWRGMVSPSTLPYLDEWERLVKQGMEACLSVATEDSEHATALRQSTPFVGILSNRERLDFFRQWAARRSGKRI